MSLTQIARAVDESPCQIADDLNHLFRSLKHTQYKAVIEPARCRACGFMFSEGKLNKPSKCPQPTLQARGVSILSAMTLKWENLDMLSRGKSSLLQSCGFDRGWDQLTRSAAAGSLGNRECGSVWYQYATL